MAVSFDINILIVDDYKTMLRVVRNMLAQLGFKNVEEATDGQQALELMKHKKIRSYFVRLEHGNHVRFGFLPLAPRH